MFRTPAVSRLVVVIASLSLGLGACGGDDDSTAEAPSEQTTTSATGEGTSEAFDEYVGLTVDDAGALAEEQGRPWRVVKEDGQDRAVTLDFIDNRLNFEVEDGVVVRVTTG